MYYLGVDLGGTNIAVGLVDENGKIISKSSIPTLPQRSHKEILKDMALHCLKVLLVIKKLYLTCAISMTLITRTSSPKLDSI